MPLSLLGFKATNSTRVIWTGPSPSAPAIAMTALPHPRSSRLLAAETRAASGAESLFMIPAKQLSAASVCERAKDLISVGVLAIYFHLVLSIRPMLRGVRVETLGLMICFICSSLIPRP